jgi:glycyl-tRNA synthetase alpha subunit
MDENIFVTTINMQLVIGSFLPVVKQTHVLYLLEARKSFCISRRQLKRIMTLDEPGHRLSIYVAFEDDNIVAWLYQHSLVLHHTV